MSSENLPKKIQTVHNDGSVFDAIMQKLLLAVNSTLEGHTSWSESEIKRITGRFQEVFKATLCENTNPEKNTDSSNSFSFKEQPVDVVELRRRLNQEVMPVLDTQTTDAIRRRKHLPHQCAHLAAKRCKHDVIRVQNTDAVVDPAPLTEPGDQELRKSVTRTEVQHTDCIKTLIKASRSRLQQLESSSRALHMLSTQLASSTDDVIFHSDQSAASTGHVGLKRKLEEEGLGEGRVAIMVQRFDSLLPAVALHFR